jgi:outer membrane protein OmpA-like peptidoglycan-associated protein
MRLLLSAPPVTAGRGPGPALQRCGHHDEQVRRSGDAPGPASAPPLVRDVLETPGSGLDPGVRADMERRLGHDFGSVRVHADSRAAASADAVASLAYTVGSHVVLGRTVAPATDQGRRILAHELVHTIQQGPSISRSGPLPVGSPFDAAEQEAERLAWAVTGPSAAMTIPRRPASAAPPATRSPLAIQRACGPQILSMAGCASRSGDITDFGGTSEDVFRFVADCDDLAPGEKSRLSSYAARITPEDLVTVDGFASEEGAAPFNLDLSCARAITVLDVLTDAGVAPTGIRLYAHGATPGDRPLHRSVVITVTRAATPAPAPPAAPPQPPGPVPETEDCLPWQKNMLTSHLNDARSWAEDAYSKLETYASDYAKPDAPPVPTTDAAGQAVETALRDNFHTTEWGYVMEIKDNLLLLRIELSKDMTFECEDEGCDDKAYVRGGIALIRRHANIHVCPPWYAQDYFNRVRTLIHERAHQYPGARDKAYNWSDDYKTLSPKDAINNADSYAVLIRQIYHLGSHGPGT